MVLFSGFTRGGVASEAVQDNQFLIPVSPILFAGGVSRPLRMPYNGFAEWGDADFHVHEHPYASDRTSCAAPQF